MTDQPLTLHEAEAALAGVTGVPALGVSLALLLVQYGFEKLTTSDAAPDN